MEVGPGEFAQNKGAMQDYFRVALMAEMSFLKWDISVYTLPDDPDNFSSAGRCACRAGVCMGPERTISLIASRNKYGFSCGCHPI